MSVKTPISRNLASLVCPSDESLLSLCGGHRWDGLRITTDQYSQICKWATVTKDFPKTDPATILYEADASKEAQRLAKLHGMRMIAFVAKFLEPGADPVQWLGGLLCDAGYDSEYWEDEEEL